MTILYCDCFSGISGDMFLGALVDAGLPLDFLADHLKRLNLAEFKGVTVERVHREALAAVLLKLDIQEYDSSSNHDVHDHYRRLNAIQTLIEISDLPDTVKQISLKIFQKLAEAEAKVHGCSVEEVHFHEVGAVDSILDIVGSAVGLHYFNITSFYASALPLGTGQVKTQHGVLPLPAPATLELLRLAQAPVVASSTELELVTPTGAGILAALATFMQPNMRLKRIGMGAGQRNLARPNVLRVLIGDEDPSAGNHLEIESNFDDMNPQILGHVMAKLFQAGALDVYFTPIFMKKNRPAAKLSVILNEEDEFKISDLILRETSTLGLRVTRVWRHEAEREMRNISTIYGEIPVKLKFMNGNVIQATPEFDACVRLAESVNVPVQRILQEAAAASRTIMD
jgi:pyridinium-3,5-bisthiocarboxylic acid mononucleotide nickel chelatase